ESLRPRGRHIPPLALWTHPTVPAHLLHVIVQLDAVSIRINGVRYVIRTQGKFRWQWVEHGDPVRFEKGDGFAQLLIAPHFDAKGFTRGVGAESEGRAQFFGEQSQAVMFATSAQKDATGAVIGAFLCLDEAYCPRIKRFSGINVLNKQVHGPDFGDFEGTRQENAFDVIFGWQLLLVAMPTIDVDPLVMQGLDDLSVFRHLWQRWLLAKTTIVNGTRLAEVVPAYLLDAIIKLIGMPIRVIDIAVP